MTFDPALDRVAHRPWPLPDRPWVMTQSWHDLLFAHWRVDDRLLRPHVPAAFDLDRFDGSAWLGVVPFTMSRVAPRGVPPLPWLSAFPELNLRTYVSPRDGKRGVFFFSLDASRLPAVIGARAMFRLPYFWASMSATRRGNAVHYTSRRRRSAASFVGAYEPSGPAFTPARGSLEFFLTERYCLYHVDALGRPARLEIHHSPWQLQPARAEIAENTMADGLGIRLEGAPLLHFAKRQDVVAWWTRPIRT
ncbi:MAG TPA: DUF2071 domain-containing protein [Vicinamibacterales bacterium]|jgi:hypothetical protein|nr:DUF2071 domain-containing protein [Vicinamibacterales bacterium]